MSAPLIYSGRRAKLLTQDGLLRPDGSIIDNNGTPNLIKNGHAEINVTGWTVSKNTVAASRPDSGFVTSSTNITWTRNTTNPIDGQADFLYTKDAANRQGEQVYCGFTVSKKYRAKVLQIEVDYLVNSGTFSAGSSSTDSDVIVYIYDVTNSTFIEPSSFKFLSSSSTIADKFVANFQTSATGSSYRILFHQATTSSSAFAVQFKEVRVSPCNYVYGTLITDWVAYTPTFSNLGTVSSILFWSRRVGDTLEVKGLFQTGTTSGAGAAAIFIGYAGISGNVSIDTTKITQGNGVGVLTLGNTSTTLFGGSVLTPLSGNYVNLGIQSSTTSSQVAVFGSALASNTYYTVNFSVPIQGWSSSTQVSDGYDGREISFSAEGVTSNAVGANTVVSYNTVTIDKTNSYNTTTDVWTAPASGTYEIYAQHRIITTGTAAVNQYAGLLIQVDSVTKREFYNYVQSTGISNWYVNGSYLVNLTAGQGVRILADTNITSPQLGTSAAQSYIQIKKLQAPQTMSATEVVAARIEKNGGQTSITSDVALTSWTATIDTHAAWSSNRYNFPVAGIYEIIGTGTFDNTAGTSRVLQYRINGGSWQRFNEQPSAGASIFTVLSCNTMVTVTAGSYIEFGASSGTSVTFRENGVFTPSWFNIKRIK